MQFLRKKARKRKLEAFSLNELLPDEITDDLLQESANARQAQRRDDAARKRKFTGQLQRRVASPPTDTELQHASIGFVEPCDRVDVREALMRYRCVLSEPTDARFIITSDVLGLNDLVSWHRPLLVPGYWIRT